MRKLRVVLASLSPRRRELLAGLLEEFEVLESSFREEEAALLGSPRETAEEFARLKALGAGVADGLILAADTVIDCEGAMLGKPVDREDAFRMLCLLSGKAHQVVTGVSVIDHRRKLRSVTSVVTEVRMRLSSESTLWDYIDTLEPMDKAGAYAIQGQGEALVESIRGCYTNVVGLPLCEVFRLLSQSEVRLRKEAGLVCRDPRGTLCPRISLVRSDGKV